MQGKVIAPGAGSYPPIGGAPPAEVTKVAVGRAPRFRDGGSAVKCAETHMKSPFAADRGGPPPFG